MTITYNAWPKTRFSLPEIQPAINADTADYVSVLYDAGETGTDEFIKKQIDRGVYTKEELSIIPTPKQANSSPSIDVQPSLTECGIPINETSFDDNLQLSKYFNLGQLSNKSALPQVRVHAQRNLSSAEIVCNLKLLAVNSLDKIKERYPDMFVSNAFRNPEGASAGRSQHEIGQAADIQFHSANKNKDLYYDIVLWIKDNVPHDQLLLEYKTTGSGLPWIHISYNKDGNRPSSDPTKNLTFLNHKKHSVGYVNLAWFKNRT